MQSVLIHQQEKDISKGYEQKKKYKWLEKIFTYQLGRGQNVENMLMIICDNTQSW